ncbi:MAG: PCRF domain-containing protein, partial [Verrucomicrobiales bacterium]|nr:PCRF domain-containing protein [Verrucomicrobiales bacterium]
MDFEPLIEKKKQRLDELESIMSAEDFYSEPKQAAKISREYNYIKKLLEDWEYFANSRRQLEENYELVRGDDEEMATLAQEEIPDLESNCERLELEIQYALLPQDKTEDRDAIVEIRAGTGGDEASLFAGDLFRMYQRFSELSGWKIEPLESSPSEVGG